MRQLDELTRAISQVNKNQEDYPQAIPQVTGSQARDMRPLSDEWDNSAVEAQREEIIIRISEFESRFEQRGIPQSDNTEVKDSLGGEIESLQSMLSVRRDNVSEILASHVARLHELRSPGTIVSHSRKDQMKNDISAMKIEIAFLEQRTADLDKLARLVEQDDRRRGNEQYALEDDSKNWDLWLETSGHR